MVGGRAALVTSHVSSACSSGQGAKGTTPHTRLGNQESFFDPCPGGNIVLDRSGAGVGAGEGAGKVAGVLHRKIKTQILGQPKPETKGKK